MKKILLSTFVALSLVACNRDNDDAKPVEELTGVASLNETFEGATFTGTTPFGSSYGTLPYNDWTSNEGYPKIYIGGTDTNKQISGYSFRDAGKPIFLFSPEVKSVEGTLKFVFAGQDGTFQVGTITDRNNIETFTSVKEYTLDATGTKNEVEINIPASKDKFLAFRYLPSSAHKIFAIDNIVFTPKK